MAQVKLNKASLSLKQRDLKNYQRYLPSLELKRKKLLSERNILDEQIIALKGKKTQLEDNIQSNFPMVAEGVNLLKQFIQIEHIDISEENIVGVKLPVFNSVKFKIADYSYLNSPHWFDPLINSICSLVEIGLQINVALSRSQLLAKSIQTVTQRKNLFEKVLIPTTVKHIRLIQIFLADNERAAVVRSKLAKKKRQLM